MEEIKKEISMTTRLWKVAVDTNNLNKVVDLYDNSALLYATFITRLDTPHKISEYFQHLFEKTDFSVSFDSQDIRVFADNVAINSGTYTFSYISEFGKLIAINARYTFVYLREDNCWKIIEHHSSVNPE